MKFSILCCLLFSSTLSAAIIQLEEGCVCGCTDPVMKAYLNHIDPGGIGYDKGYTTLGLFLAPFQPFQECVVPFFDFRGHVFNDGKFALNAGLGLRYLSCRLWGINAYYDFRHSSCKNYNQIGIGLESLGQRWDFRLNGYLPMGDHDCEKKYKKEFAMGGIDGEIGVYLTEWCNGYIYLAGGPYWLHHKHKDGFGGKFRLVTSFLNYINIEGDVSHDPIFKTKVQGQIGFSIPFGPRYEVIKRCGFSCSKTMLQRRMSLREVERKEILVLKMKHDHEKVLVPIAPPVQNQFPTINSFRRKRKPIQSSVVEEILPPKIKPIPLEPKKIMYLEELGF